MSNNICYSIIALRRLETTAQFIASVYNKDAIPFLFRSKAPELMNFISKSVATRVRPGEGISVYYNENIEMYAHCESSNVSNRYVFTFTSKSYPVKAARMVARETLEWLDNKMIVNPECSTVSIETEFKERLKKYQDPLEIDKIAKLTKMVEDTKALMVQNIEMLLQRGESIDDLVRESEDLSLQSKQYAIAAKKLKRRCCTIM